MNNKLGFSLVEMLFVIAAISVMSVAVHAATITEPTTFRDRVMFRGSTGPDFDAGNSFSIGGTKVTATAAGLNAVGAVSTGVSGTSTVASNVTAQTSAVAATVTRQTATLAPTITPQVISMPQSWTLQTVSLTDTNGVIALVVTGIVANVSVDVMTNATSSLAGALTNVTVSTAGITTNVAVTYGVFGFASGICTNKP